jgi:hypothetical protein
MADMQRPTPTTEDAIAYLFTRYDSNQMTKVVSSVLVQARRIKKMQVE